MTLQEKILTTIDSLNYTYDCRRSKFAKPGLIQLCNEILPKLNKDNTIVEIGTFSGISSFIFSYFFNKVITIDPYLSGYDPSDLASQPDKMDLNKVEEECITKTLGNRANIEKIKLKSEQAVGLFEDNSLDCVYIDGNHQYEAVKFDINVWLPKVKKNGIICGHDFRTKHHPGTTKAVEEAFIGKKITRFPDSSWIVYL